MEKIIKISGMSCQHCVASVKKALEQLGGVSRVEVDLERAQARLLLEEGVSLEQVEKAVEEAGYRVEGWDR
ncbi:MAG: heavy-metal-associated domain-containing protein [bacterium]